MDTIINRIVALAGPAREAPYRRHLLTLDPQALFDLERDLRADAKRPHSPRWGRMRTARRTTEVIFS